MKTSTQKRSLGGGLRSWMPDSLCNDAECVGAFTALCVGKGAQLLQAQARRGIAVERIGEVPFSAIIPNTLSKQDIERIALRVGADAMHAYALRRVLAEGGDSELPEINRLVRHVMSAAAADQ
ncbi:MAG: hypothetical protein K2Y42_20615 [Hyphomicrobium sp.]|uniref:hypothetical protein n=1 Tax=Hyphomicrobium sp. TaxID=82 RepID=UPI0025BE5424|nr:hypothetical protein [Hyphomicrobium sp.]MBX9865152.1 hypothetical protein [Hyphomicrobium sp.]